MLPAQRLQPANERTSFFRFFDALSYLVTFLVSGCDDTMLIERGHCVQMVAGSPTRSKASFGRTEQRSGKPR